MPPRTAIITYSLYHHIAKLARASKSGVESAGGTADIFQVQETLPEKLLTALKAPPKPDFPIADLNTLKDYDAFLFGVPTRYGNMPSQFKNFWDGTGSLFATQALAGKCAGFFVSTGSLGSGQEATIMNCLSTIVHHGMTFIPFGYGHPRLGNLQEIHGGSPWGAGTFAAPDGSREVTELELELAKTQGAQFYEKIKKLA